MFVHNGIAYAGEAPALMKISGVRPLANGKLWVRFVNGEAKVADLLPLFETPAFAPLADEKVFREVYIDRGIPVWLDGEIDLSPEYLYEHGRASEDAAG